jgi:RecA-family ATPase
LHTSQNNKNYDVSVSEYAALRKLASKKQIAILVVHHTKKKTEVSQSPQEQIKASPQYGLLALSIQR